MNRLFIISVFCWYACSGNNVGQATADNRLQTPVPALPPAGDLIKTDDFEVARLDYSQNRLQRIFVVIRPDKAADTTFILRALCALKKHYPVDGHTGVSFFSDKKFTNYKDELFVVEGHPLPESEYENWLNLYYLGEFEFETSLYTAFPVSIGKGKQNAYTLDLSATVITKK